MEKFDLIIEGLRDVRSEVQQLRSDLMHRPCAVHTKQIEQLIEAGKNRLQFTQWLIGLAIGLAVGVAGLVIR